MIISKEDEVREALRSVIDPEIGLNVVELGLIRELEATEEKTKITMILTTPFCPYGPAMIEQVRMKASEVASGLTTDYGVNEYCDDALGNSLYHLSFEVVFERSG